MKIKHVAKLPPLERFLYWISERHAIYERREAGKPKPWTDDEVLQSVFFTNPYRENDKVTRWFRTFVREPMAKKDDVVFATVCFRWFNYIPTGRLLLDYGLLARWNCRRAITMLSAVRADGNQVFTGAFNISNSGSTKDKITRVCEDYITPIWNNRTSLVRMVQNGGTMELAHRALSQYLGMGGSGFMAYEVVCDLRYTKFLEHAGDKCTWSNPGPGAKRGLNRVLERPLGQSVKDWPEQSRRLLRTVQKQLCDMPPFEMREIEHSLCEFDKYERARLGDGHLKRKYNGT